VFDSRWSRGRHGHGLEHVLATDKGSIDHHSLFETWQGVPSQTRKQRMASPRILTLEYHCCKRASKQESKLSDEYLKENKGTKALFEAHAGSSQLRYC
jgi:hypothetical protein